MAAVERVLVAQGWHLPRWRTTNKDYGKFYQPHIPAHAPKDPPHFLHRPPHLHHVVDYTNCSDQCRPHLRHHATSTDVTSSSSSFHDAAAVGGPFVRNSIPAHHGVGLNAHIQHLTLQKSQRVREREVIRQAQPIIQEKEIWRVASSTLTAE